VRNVIWHNLAPKLVGKISFHLFLPIRREFIPEIIRIGAGSDNFSQLPAMWLLLFDACL